MNRCLFLTVVFLAGCASHNLPAVKKIDHIRISVTRMPDEKEDAAKPRSGKLTEQKDIVEMMDWLHTIDWSQSGTDLTKADVPRPDGGITIIDKSAATHIYSFYWDGGFVHTLNNRLIRGGDVNKLRQIVERVCK
jgi:hypothetical protein